MIAMPNVGIYCRLSIEDRDKSLNDPSASIQNQMAMLRDFCHEREWDIFDFYVDDGYSGVDPNRPDFRRLIKDCEDGNIDIVLCKDQSRFSRDTIIIEQYINDRFLEWGIRFIGVADNADTESETYSTMRLFTSAYNEMYVKDISAKIRRTLAYKRENGQFIGSFAPYGYLIDPTDKHHLIVDPQTAPVIKMIFDMYINGEGYRSIVMKLNSDGVVSPTEYKHRSGSKYVNCNAETSYSHGLWTQSTVSRILSNEVYTGTLVQGKSHSISYKNKKRKKVDPSDWIRTPNAHTAIIDNDTWIRSQERLNSHARVGKRSDELSPLSGKVRCAVCGRPMKRNVYYNKARTIRYYNLQCASYKTGAMNCQNTKSISGITLENAVLTELNSIIHLYCQFDKIRFNDMYALKVRQLESELAMLSERRVTAQNRLLSMYKDKLDGTISDEDFALFRQSLSDEEKVISAKADDVSRQISEYKKCICNAGIQQSVLDSFSHFDSLDRSVSDEFIDFIEVGECSEKCVREVHIHWKL